MAKVDEPPQGRDIALSAPAPLSGDHDVSRFDCGVPALDAWLKERALKNESRFSRTYVVCHDDRVVAFFCISAGSVERAAAPARIRRNAPGIIPVSIIGRLAVERAYAGHGLGAEVLSDALRRIAMASRSIGIAAVLVHPKDDAATRFYMRCAEFIEYPDGSGSLYLPIETVLATLE